MIGISGELELKRAEGSEPISQDEANAIIAQIFRDAHSGTFDLIPNRNHLIDYRPTFSPQELSEKQKIWPHGSLGHFGFELRLKEELFPLEEGGFQHLFSALAGDVFPSSVGNISVALSKVSEIKYGDQALDLREAGSRPLRENETETTVELIRRRLGLEEGLPLLAFTCKPRTGLTDASFRDIALAVLGAGFDVVEMDTRDFIFSDERLKKLAELGIEAKKNRKTLSINFSAPPHIAAQRLEDMVKKYKFTPGMLKVDGGLDGLGTLQAIRAKCEELDIDPIVTCYPLLRRTLRNFVGEDAFTYSLWHSGADIIYIGDLPPIGVGPRPIDAANLGNVSGSTKRYRQIAKSGKVMPTVAGGIHFGQLHAYYELVGPDAGFFLGGCIALHPDGLVEGAKLCVELMKHARKLKKDRRRGETPKDFESGFRHRVENATKKRANYDSYLPPSKLAEKFPEVFERNEE